MKILILLTLLSFNCYAQFSDLPSSSPASIGDIGDVLLSSATDSDILFYNGDTSKWNNSDKWGVYNQALTGMSRERQEVTIEASGSNLYYVVEQVGGGDITYIFGSEEATLNCTTVTDTEGLGHNKARVLMTAGTATSPQLNFMYVVRNGDVAVLLVSSTVQPTGEFGWVGIASVPDVTTWATTGAYMHQRFSESLLVSGRGLFSNEREKIRKLGAVYRDGVAQILVIDETQAPDSAVFECASGTVYQLHRQTFPAFASPTTYYVVNDPVTPYKAITDLNEIEEDANGDTITSRRFNLVIWGAINKSSAESKLYVNLPNGSYGTDNAALADSDGTAVTTIPSGFEGVGFLIARLPLRRRTVSGGTIENLVGGTGVVDLRGLRSGYNISSGGTSKNEFIDTAFRIFDDGDETKKMSFETDGITTGTVRTLTVPNDSGTIALTNIDNNFTATQTITKIILPVGDSGGESPTLGFGDGDTGIYEIQDDVLGVSVDGGYKFYFSGVNMSSIQNYGALLRSSASQDFAPAHSFTNDTDTGVSRTDANTLALVVNGARGLQINPTTSGVNYATITPSASGSDVGISSAGSDTNINIDINPKGTGYVTVKDTIEIGSADTYGRNQIHNYATDALIKIGSSFADGDASDVEGEGGIFYGLNLEGTQDGTNVGWARVKPDRFGLYNKSSILGMAYYYFRADPDGIYLTDDTATKTFNADRLTGAVDASGDMTLNNGVLRIAETTTPVASGSYGAIYTKSDNLLYFQDGSGSETALGSGSTKSVATKTNDYDMASGGDVILVDATSNSVDITLPTPAAGKQVTIKVINISNTVRILPDAAETIDGAASITFSSIYESYTLVSDGTNWFIIASSQAVLG